MATTIKIGKAQIRDEDYAIQANAVLGIRGTGKTTLAKSIAEQLLDKHVPIIVFDPTGVWRYLKRGARKGSRGYPIVVAGGMEPDLQLTPSSAAEIVRSAIKENVSLVVDLYDKKLSKADWRRIVRDCFRTLMYENEGVRHIFLEEAAEFVPQRVGAAEGEVYAEVEKVVRMGGNASLGITMINQRSQEVNKAVLELCENLVLMKQRGAHAIDAIEKWVDKLDPRTANEVSGNLSNLEAGECFVFKGGEDRAIRTHGNKLHTFHPDRRRPEAIKRAGTTPDVAKFVAKLGERLKDKTALDTLESLRARIKTLEKERASEVHVEISPKELHAKCVPKDQADLYKGEVLMLRKKLKEWEKYHTMLVKRFSDIHEIAVRPLISPAPPSTETMEIEIRPPRKGEMRIKLKNGSTIRGVGDGVPLRGISHAEAQRKQTANMRGLVDNLNASASDELTGPQRSLMKSLFWLQKEPMTWPKVAFYAGYKPGRYIKDRLGELRTKGLVDKGSFSLTPQGFAYIGEDVEGKPTGKQLRETVRGMLTGPQNVILDVLLAAEEPLNTEDVSRVSGYEVGRYLKDRIGELRTLELINGNDKSGGMSPSPFFLE